MSRKSDARAARRAAYLLAEHDLAAATLAVNGSPLSTRAHLLLTPLSQAAQAADPEVWAGEVEQGRTMLRNCLVSAGHTPNDADALIARLEAAHAAWLATPER